MHKVSWLFRSASKDIFKTGNLKNGVRCERLERALSVVLKTLSLGFYRTSRGPNGGSIEPLGVRLNFFRGLIESF